MAKKKTAKKTTKKVAKKVAKKEEPRKRHSGLECKECGGVMAVKNTITDVDKRYPECLRPKRTKTQYCECEQCGRRTKNAVDDTIKII